MTMLNTFTEKTMLSVVVVMMVFSAQAMSVQQPALGGAADNDHCVLSFVVPRDKMKSSCELDEKVNRRINAMEMKVNIYKQQVNELQQMLQKERQHNAEALDIMEKRIQESSVNEDMGYLIERRLELLEKSFEQLQSDEETERATTAPAAEERTRVGGQDESEPVSNAVDNSPVTLPNLVRSLVQAEVKTVMDNFTSRFEAYVKDQIVVYNQVFNMMPQQGGRTSQPQHTDKAKPTSDKKKEGLFKELQNVRDKLDATSGQIAKHVGDYIKNITSDRNGSSASTDSSHYNNHDNNSENIDATEAPTTTIVQQTDKLAELPIVNKSELVLSEEDVDTNDTFSGENPVTGEEPDLTTVNSDISESRISHKSGNGSDASEKDEATAAAGSWKENMIQDQYYKLPEIEAMLKDQITGMLYSPLAEVMSLVEKHAEALEDKIRLQGERNQEVTKDLTSDVKQLDQRLEGFTLQVESLTQGLQDSFAKLDQIKALEHQVEAIKHDIASRPSNRLAIVVDEQDKRLKNVERIVRLYTDSTDRLLAGKKEDKQLRETLLKEVTTFKGMFKALHDEVNMTIADALSDIRHNYSEQFNSLTERLRIYEDASLLLQIDLSAFERKLDNRNSRFGRDVEKLQQVIDEVESRQREIRKKFEMLEQDQDVLKENFTLTGKELFDLKTEVKLSVLNEWLPLTFDYDSSRTECFGDQYVKRSGFENGKLVGVVLCSPARYKIFLSNSLDSKFLNIGDSSGMGEDHCEFVGAPDDKRIRLSPFRSTFGAVEGFTRNHWGQQPVESLLNTIKPSPHWYECGVSIP